MNPSDFGLIVISFGLLAGVFGIWIANSGAYQDRVREKESRDRFPAE